MIDPKELRIGNWVLGYAHKSAQERTPIQITSIGRDGINLEWDDLMLRYAYFLPQLQPIPLTLGILERCGFENSRLIALVWNENDNKPTTIVHGGILKDVLYLHQLQNLYFALTGIELNYSPDNKINP